MAVRYLTDRLLGVRPLPITPSAAKMGMQLVDRHFTPYWVTEALLHNYSTPAGNILEPARGLNKITRVLEPHHRAKGMVHASDIADHMILGNFIGPCYWWYWRHGNRKHFSCVITNPPFTLAEQFVARAFEMLDPTYGGDVVLLLRLGFLASKRRREFYRRYPLRRLLVLSNRPSFAVSGETDNSEYGWFIWSSRMDLASRVGPLIETASQSNGWTEKREPMGAIFHIGKDDAKAFRSRSAA